jgi:hypothetical protein
VLFGQLKETSMTDALHDLREAVRAATDVLARDYAVRKAADKGFDADGYFFDLRRLIEARAVTLDTVRREGAMGGGGPDEA